MYGNRAAESVRTLRLQLSLEVEPPQPTATLLFRPRVPRAPVLLGARRDFSDPFILSAPPFPLLVGLVRVGGCRDAILLLLSRQGDCQRFSVKNRDVSITSFPGVLFLKFIRRLPLA